MINFNLPQFNNFWCEYWITLVFLQKMMRHNSCGHFNSGISSSGNQICLRTYFVQRWSCLITQIGVLSLSFGLRVGLRTFLVLCRDRTPAVAVVDLDGGVKLLSGGRDVNVVVVFSVVVSIWTHTRLWQRCNIKRSTHYIIGIHLFKWMHYSKVASYLKGFRGDTKLRMLAMGKKNLAFFTCVCLITYRKVHGTFPAPLLN